MGAGIAGGRPGGGGCAPMGEPEGGGAPGRQHERESRRENQRDRDRQRELWRKALAAKAGGKGRRGAASHADAPFCDDAAKTGHAEAGRPLPPRGRSGGKGIGPNKASGHKGGMGRQGSKRG